LVQEADIFYASASMKQALKKILIDVLGLVKVYPTALTDKKELKALIHKLFPISTDKDLIRLGPKGDGGYLIPNDLDGIKACFSPGVESISGFEKNCADLGMQVFLADKSVDMPAIHHNKFHFTKKHIGAKSSGDFMTIDEWVNTSLSDTQSDLLLQMDIEGCEYETFMCISDRLLRRFRIIVAEFHNLENLCSRPFFNLASRAFEKILQSHVCVHIHPNNQCRPLRIQGIDISPLSEFTFLRKDRVSNPTFANVFPHPLDCDNTSTPPLPLPQCWYCK
jgi:hypothetical protein